MGAMDYEDEGGRPDGGASLEANPVAMTCSGAGGEAGGVQVHLEAEYFDPSSCCDAHERAMIAALRAYLRPDVAPECLMARLKEALDRCCR